MKPIVLVRLAFVLALFAAANLATAGTLYYAFEDASTKGGIAKVEVDSVTGGMTGHEILWSDLLGTSPLRLAMNGTRDRLILVRDTKEGTNLLVFDLTQKKLTPILLEFGARPGEVVVRDDVAVVTGSRGRVVAVDLKAGRVKATFDGRKALNPPGSTAENAAFTKDGSKVLVTYQEDGESGKEHGQRLVVLSTADMKLVADVPLPRDQGTLHPPGSAKEAGPGPELVIAAEESNAVLLTYDIYGGVAIADFDQLLTGKWSNAKFLPTSLDQTAGTAFPDRALRIAAGGKDLAIAFNAGPNGGAAIVDLKERSILFRIECPHGLDTPSYLPGAELVVAANCGKVKTRTATGITKDKFATNQLVILDLKPLAAGKPPEVRVIQASNQLHRTHAVDEAKSALVAALLKSKEGSQIATFDVALGKEIGAIDAFGKARASTFKP